MEDVGKVNSAKRKEMHSSYVIINERSGKTFTHHTVMSIIIHMSLRIYQNDLIKLVFSPC